MPKTIETTVYLYDELPTEEAKEKARDWFYGVTANDDWWQYTYEDAENIGLKITGFDLYHHTIEGEFTQDADNVALKIKGEHGESCDTYKTAVAFLSAHDEYHGVNGKITLAEAADDSTYELEKEYKEAEKEFLHDLLQDYLSMLQQEYDSLSEREYLEDGIRANEYTFTADGKRFG